MPRKLNKFFWRITIKVLSAMQKKHFVIGTFRNDAQVEEFNNQNQGKGKGYKLDLSEVESIKQLSYYQALQADKFLPDDYFKDKLVFVGVRSLTATLPDRQSADHYPTPLTR